ncbi:MAG: class I SAM-dependent methyltransferase [Phycisphaerales bacterium]
MSEQERYWDERFGTDEFIYGTEPNSFLASCAHLIPARGRVLCLADGEGRNSVHLARAGYRVTGVDHSKKGLEKARSLAARAGVDVEYVQADLGVFDLGAAAWDGIVSVFAHTPGDVRRALHARIGGALADGGVLILEAYTPAQLGRGTGGPRDEAMMMSAAGLREELDGVVFDRLEELEREIVEGTHHSGVGAVVQAVGRRAAR